MVASRAKADERRLSFAPDNQRQLQRGIAVLEHTLGPTLGPGGSAVAIGRIGRPNQPPELLVDASTIARRMTGLPDRFGNIGFMLARHAAWKMRTEVHDGAATAVVMLAVAHRELQRLVEAGANRVELKHQVESAVDVALSSISAAATPLNPSEYETFAASMAGNHDVARVVVEALAVLGSDATIVTRASTGRRIELECIEGALWESTAVIAPLVTGFEGRRQLSRPRVLLWDGPLDDVRQLATALSRLCNDDARAILVIAQSFSSEVLGLFTMNSSPELLLVPVTAPQDGQQQDSAYGDIAVLTGSKRLSIAAGDSLVRLDPETVGILSRATVGPRFLNLLAVDEQSDFIDARIASVRHLMATTEDEREWKRLQLRLGRLQQGMGMIWVGAATESERDYLLQCTERALSGLRAASTSGVVPGAGASLLAISRTLAENGRACGHPGTLVVAKALEAQARWLARNAGLDPDWAVARGLSEAPERGLDVSSGEIADLRAGGVVDPASTLIEAIRIALTTPVLASDCGELIHSPKPLHQADIRP